MEIYLSILLIIVAIILLTRKKKTQRRYTSSQPDISSEQKNNSSSSVIPEQNDVIISHADSEPLKTTHAETTIKIEKPNTSVSSMNVSTTYSFGSTITINGKKISGEDAEKALNQIFGKVTVVSDFDFDNDNGETKQITEEGAKRRKTQQKEEKRKQQLTRCRKELDSIVKFIWPSANYEYPYNITQDDALANVMFFYDPYKDLYRMYEHLLVDYPKKMTELQKTWTVRAVKEMFRRAAYIFYNNDDSILEEYKYLRENTHLQKILFDNADEFPQLIAALAAWATYQGDYQCLRDMLSQYEKLNREEQRSFGQQLADSLSRTREDIFNHSPNEIKETIDLLRSFTDSLIVEDPEEKKIQKALLFLRQGYDEKTALEDIEKGRIKTNRRNRQSHVPSGSTSLPLERIEDPDSDRYALYQRLSHVRWKYNYLSDNPEDQNYIKRGIRSLTHIDWDDVEQLIDGSDPELASQMRVFREAATQIRKYRVWNKIDKSCPNTIDVKYKYPDGKTGDVNRGLALCYGVEQPEQVDALTWKVSIDPRKYHDIIDMMVNGQFGVINDIEETKRIQTEQQVQFLIRYNNYAKLRAMTNSVVSGEGITKTNYFSIASSIQSNYYHQLRDARNLFYQELIVTTGSSSKWKSEQQVYSLVRYEFPDAIYQYHTSWLGKQSLDVFIPSLSVGIEYQGVQHYEPVEIFGGEEGFRGVVERDERKLRLCAENGIRLIYWKYDEQINSDLLHEKMKAIASK